MRGWYCNEEIERKSYQRRKRIFCSLACSKMYQSEVGFYSKTGLISRQEERHRKTLLKRARKGNKRAIKELREKYHITAIWNGKEMMRLV